MTLRVPCVHGKWEAHGTYVAGLLDANVFWECPGGREPTVEEVTQWLAGRDYLVSRAWYGHPVFDEDDSAIRLQGERPEL